MSAPCSKARAPTGVATVLSRISGTPAACAACDHAGMSMTFRRGLPIVSPKTSFVFSSASRGDRARVVRVGPAHLDPVLGQRVGEEVVGAAVELTDGDDVVAGARDVQHGVGHRGLAGRRHDGPDAALQVGEPLLQDPPGGVHDARVDVAGDGEREEVRGVLRVVEDVRRRLVDRDRAGVGGRVRLLAAVQGDGLGPGLLVAHGRGSWVTEGRRDGHQNTRTRIGKRHVRRPKATGAGSRLQTGGERATMVFLR